MGSWIGHGDVSAFARTVSTKPIAHGPVKRFDFGLSLLVVKGISSAETTINDIYRAALPFFGLSLIVMAAMIAFPDIVLWLPRLMD